MEWIPLLLIAVLVGYVVCYNGLVKAKQKVDEAWSGITVQLKRRHELIPNLVKAANVAMQHEQDVLDKVLEARTSAIEAMTSNDPQAINDAEVVLSGALNRFIGYTEDNPEIKGTESLLQFQTQLEETEDQISASRRLFNGNVQAYNTKVLSIPWNYIANAKGFKTETMFEVDPLEFKQISAAPTLEKLGAKTH